jgi:mannosyl-3-phosphoglycerate phosphatase
VSSQDRTRVVITDLDGTLLDGETYDVRPAQPGLDALRERRVSVVLCSSKTRAEMEPLARELGLDAPLIVENGGAIVLRARMLPFVPPGGRQDGDHLVVPLGSTRDVLLAALDGVAKEAGVAVRSFSAMTPGEVAKRTGLDPEAATRALKREWDEPFVVEPEGGQGTTLRLEEAARRRGLRVTHGGRFYHLTGTSDKGLAVRMLLKLLPHDPHGRTVGLGDAANDLPMLETVDRPILMPRKDGTVDAALAAALPGAERAPEPGPAGWSAAILGVLAGESLPQVPA